MRPVAGINQLLCHVEVLGSSGGAGAVLSRPCSGGSPLGTTALVRAEDGVALRRHQICSQGGKTPRWPLGASHEAWNWWLPPVKHRDVPFPPASVCLLCSPEICKPRRAGALLTKGLSSGPLDSEGSAGTSMSQWLGLCMISKGSDLKRSWRGWKHGLYCIRTKIWAWILILNTPSPSSPWSLSFALPLSLLSSWTSFSVTLMSRGISRASA